MARSKLALILVVTLALIAVGACVGARVCLVRAIESGNLTAARICLTLGADANAEDAVGREPLWHALDGENLEMALLLLEHGADPNAGVENGWTHLHHAAMYGSREFVVLLLDHGADPNAQYALTGQTALHEAAATRPIEIAEVLVERGADVNAQGDLGLTPLHSTVARDRADLVEFLIDHGAEVELPDADGETPATWAATTIAPGVLRLLADRGAKLDDLDPAGNTLLHRYARAWPDRVASAASSEAHLTAQTLDRALSLEVPTLLIEAGLDVGAVNDEGQTALHVAAEMGHERLARVLLKARADVNGRGHAGRTPLHCLAAGDRMIFSIQTDAAEENDPRIRGLVEGRHFGTASALLKHGADRAARDNAGATPLDLAKATGHHDVAELLVARRPGR
ncbi:MAG TPA: ankyrin repeat domain-containing protein [Armatimonadota bacterium]|nr:ankyrin repeat domain-containing protein [Armatimonadota bacterium]